MQSISKRELFIEAFEAYKRHLNFLFNIGLLMFAIQIILPSLITNLIAGSGMIYIIYQISYTVLSTGISLGVIAQMLRIMKGGEPEQLVNVFNYFNKVPSNLLGSFIILAGFAGIGTLFLLLIVDMPVYTEIITNLSNGTDPNMETLFGEEPSLIVVGSIILMAIVIVYLSIKTHFFVYYIIDKNYSALQSLKQSFISTNGLEAELFIVWAILGCMNLAGAMLYMIGLLFTLPFTILTISTIYNRYLSK